MIQRSQFIACILVVLIFAGSRAPGQTPPAKDFQQWTNVAASWQVKPMLAVTAFGEVHTGNNVSQFDQELLSAGVTYSPARWIAVGAGYLYLHANPKLSGLNYENRIYSEITFNAPVFYHLLLSDRVRPELRWEQLPSRATFTQRYRNRIILERPIQIREKQYSPFVFWEKFYNSNVEAWSRTRYYAGVSVQVAQKESVQVYFMRQNDRYSRTFHTNVIAVSLKFHFGGARGTQPNE